MNNKIQQKFIESLTDGGMIDSIFGYAYNRCFSEYEAEDLCQEIITEILISLQNFGDIQNLNAYIWQIAHNTYTDHVSRQKRSRQILDPTVNINVNYSVDTDMENDILERIVDAENLSRIKREIAALPEIYKNVMIMYYLDGLSVAQTAEKLGIPETRVKQRLFTARNKIKKKVEVNNMSETKTKQSVKLYDLMLVFSSGNIFKYDPRDKVSSSLIRKNIIISCSKKSKSIQELSEEFDVPLAIMADEVKNIPIDFLKETDGGKYIANSIVIDIELQKEIDNFISGIAKNYFKDVKEYLLSKKDDIMKLPWINPPKSFEYFLWWYLPLFADPVKSSVSQELAGMTINYHLMQEERKAHIICNIFDPDNKGFMYKTKNHNGISNAFNMLGQHEEAVIENLSFGKYLTWDKNRFPAGQDFSYNPEIAMIFKTIYGLDIDSVSENDKEAAAKALEKGYIRKENGKLYPDVPIGTEYVSDWINWIKYGYNVSDAKPNEFMSKPKWYGTKIAVKLWQVVKDYMPQHLLSQFTIFAGAVNCLEYYLMEEGVKNGLLPPLPETQCTEGIFAYIKYPKFGVKFDMSYVNDNNILTVLKIAEVLKNSMAEKMGLQVGDVITKFDGINFNRLKEGDVLTVDRNGETLDFPVVF